MLFYHGTAAHKDVERAARQSGLYQDLDSLSDGYKTIVGERGNHLSGGQKQRVCIARALIRDPSLIIMDDALSAVDTQTEQTILAGMDEFFENRTAVLIAHRLSTVQNADLILYMEDGRVHEAGTHEQLLKRGGAYATLYHQQTQGGEA